MIKKTFWKICAFILVLATILILPGVPVASGHLLSLQTATAAYNYEAPLQDRDFFVFESVNEYDLSIWSPILTNDYLITQHLTPTTNANFHEAHPNNTLTNAAIAGHSPLVLINKTKDMPVNGAYSSGEITLPANGFYMIAVDYYVKNDTENTTSQKAFGTFYLNDMAIDLLPRSGWHTSIFYVQTDTLEDARVTAELYFGSRTQKAIGAIYFDNFTVTTVRQGEYERSRTSSDANTTRTLNLSNTQDVAPVISINNQDFIPSATPNAESYNAVATSQIPYHYLNFANRNYFYAKDGGNADSVMLLRAKEDKITLNLDTKVYKFQPKPHEVYMFQFYSITAANLTNFYFKIGDIYETITTLPNYPYHNGWQLNTVFFIAGPETNQTYNLSFALGYENVATGWACIDDLKIYKVSGNYAVNNETALGVHDIYDLNKTEQTVSVDNGYFEVGISNSLNVSTYPYPLIADAWTTNNQDNGIVNTDETFWSEVYGKNPGRINNYYYTNNNVYMMRNTSSTHNILTSPTLTTTVGETTYLSFDAYGKTEAKARAYIVLTGTANDDEDDNETDNTNQEIILGYLDINHNQWQHYEFTIAESAYATTRNYVIRFEMDGIGCTFIDNVLTSSTADNYANATQTEHHTIDLNNKINLASIWNTTDNTLTVVKHVASNGIMLENVNRNTTVIRNDFAYNLSSDKYYEITVVARGTNAAIGFSSFDGTLAITTDPNDTNKLQTYHLYLHPENNDAINFQVTLGCLDNKEAANQFLEGQIFINSITVKDLENEDEYKALTNGITEDDPNNLVLSVASETEESDTTDADDDTNPFAENWWYLIPTLITAAAVLLAVITFFLRKIKFEKHITNKTTSYARDVNIKKNRKKLVAQKVAKVDNITDESQSN